MSSVEQVVINSRAVRAGADRLENAGYQGDAVAFVEALIVAAIADGWKPLDPPVPTRGGGSTTAAREAAKQAAEAAVRDAKVKGGRL